MKRSPSAGVSVSAEPATRRRTAIRRPRPPRLTWPPLAPRGARFVGGPLVGRALFVRRAAALAGDFALLFGRHRRESSSFFAFCIHHSPPAWTTYGPCSDSVRGGGSCDLRRTRLVERRLRSFVGDRLASSDGLLSSANWTPIDYIGIKVCADSREALPKRIATSCSRRWKPHRVSQKRSCSRFATEGLERQ